MRVVSKYESSQSPEAKEAQLGGPAILHIYEFVYFCSYHPFADGDRSQTLEDGNIKYDEMVVTKVVYALTFQYVQKDRKMMPLYLAAFFGACYDHLKLKETPGWVLIRNSADEHEESGADRSAAGFGEPPPS